MVKRGQTIPRIGQKTHENHENNEVFMSDNTRIYWRGPLYSLLCDILTTLLCRAWRQTRVQLYL